MKINAVRPDKNNFLQILQGIALMPKILHYTGKIPETRTPTVAIIGTRKPTPYGKEITQTFARDLARKGVIIVSGLAFGVDSIAHRATLEVNGTTIAVLPNGLPDIYPTPHAQLARDIVRKGGALISEYPSGAPAMKHTFLERNRLVSGISDAVIITEAASRSGTLNTAMHALEQGKYVFVAPGNITSPMSAGCNLLIKQGAIPITSSEDVLEIIAPSLLKQQATLPLGDNPEQTQIIQLLSSGVRDGEELHRLSGLSVEQFNTNLTLLEINDIVRALGNNQWTLK